MGLFVEPGDGLAQRRQAQRPGVRQRHLAGHALQLGAHGRRCPEVRLAQVQADDAVAGRFELGGPLAELHGQEGGDGLGALRDLHEAVREVEGAV